MNTKLKFYDQARQNYADSVPIEEGLAAEFMVGEYDDGTGELGEFKITLTELHPDYSGILSPQLQVFGDATGALSEFIRIGGLRAIEEDVASADAFSERLIGLGLEDVSDRAPEATF